MPRIPLASRDDFGPDDQAVFDRLDQRPKPTHATYLLLANAPNVAHAMLGVSEQLRGSVHLPVHLRELAILRTNQIVGGDYEFAHHWNYALSLGVSREKLEALETFATSSLFDPTEKAVLNAAEDLAVPPLRLKEATWAALSAALDRRAVTELIIGIGWYQMGARITGAFQLELEPWFTPA